MTEVRTTCPYCGVGCGVIARVDGRGTVNVRGDPQHPANLGRLCSKGAALGQTVDLVGRRLHPEVNGERCDWDGALASVADGFRRVLSEHGPGAVAFYVSGQLLTEAYYVANKLMKGFIGTANIDTNSRLCMSSAVAAHKRAFGADLVPCAYEDLERANLIVLAGSNLAWCHPVLYQRIAQAKRRTPERRVVVIDPRRTATCELADLHLALAPGSDAGLFNGLLAYLKDAGRVGRRFVEAHTEGAGAALEAARASAPDVASVARQCGLPAADVAAFFRWFAEEPRAVTLFSQGINQSSSGTDKGNAIINCHLLTGRIGRPGAGPFSITGQPNAMGGREVGALANQLASHLELDEPRHRALVQGFWGAPRLADRPGRRAVELFDAIERGEIRAVWVMGTNPVVSLPEADRARAALAGCELVVVSDCMRHTDTTAVADVLLPALTWGERDGTVTNSERCISRQRPFLPPPGEARADWWSICEVAKRMGFEEAFTYEGPHQIFDEHARLSALAGGAFDIGALAGGSAQDYEALRPVQWPVPRGGQGAGRARLFRDGRFATPDGRARLVPVVPRPPAHRVDDRFPLALNTGRVRDHWHTLTRTAKSPRLAAHTPEPYVELHPRDARRAGVGGGELARVSSAWGAVLVRVRVGAAQRPGSVFVPMHWSDIHSAQARIGAAVNAALDPVSGQPESKHTPVRVEPWPAAWHGLVLSRRRLDMGAMDYWTCERGPGLWLYHVAGRHPPADWHAAARALLCRSERQVNWVEYADTGTGLYRAARLTGARLESCILIESRYPAAGRDRVLDLFRRDVLSAQERAVLLSGQGCDAGEGSVLCACAGVTRGAIEKAVREGRAASVQELGVRFGAGANCGSCVPELQHLLAIHAER